jgi:hypothetical protein
MIRLPESIDYEEVPLEKRYKTATRALSARIGALYRRAVDEFGDDALEIIRTVNRDHARDLAREMCRSESAANIEGAALCLARLLDLVGAEGEITELSSEVARVRIDECLYGIANPELCQARLTLESEFVKALNPSLAFEIEKCAARGDDACAFRIRSKE